MAPSRPTSKPKTHQTPRRPKHRPTPTAPDPTQLLETATAHLHASSPDLALPPALLALKTLQFLPPETNTLPALTLLASIHLALGSPEGAYTYYHLASTLDPTGTSPSSGAETFLWLAQLSPTGGEESLQYLEKACAILRRQIGEATEEEDREALREKLSTALCSTTELWMTDLPLHPSAEPSCQTLVTEALLLSPTSPTPLQTLASIRISQSRFPEAREALKRSLELWMALEAGDERRPEMAGRIGCARLLVEVGMGEEAVEVVEGVVGEEEGCVEGWYLGGWGMWLLGGGDGGGEGWVGIVDQMGEEERKGFMEGSREWMGRCLRLIEAEGWEDEGMREHVFEILGKLEGLLGPEEDGDGEGDGDEGWEEDEEEEGDGKSEMDDV